MQTSRSAAIALGDFYYLTEKPCVRGHIARRYTNDGHCTICGSERQVGKTTGDPLRRKERIKKWTADNVARAAAHRGKARVQRKYPQRIDPRMGTDAFVPFYDLALFWTRQTGVKYEVDHIVPLACGGMHTPSNLRVITMTENRRRHRKVAV